MTETTNVTFDRERLANWYAQQHRKIDDGVEAIFHLPTGAPPREIRLLEVNTQVPEMTPLEAVDFGVDTGSNTSHTLLVLDISPTQWNYVKKGLLSLPGDWTLSDMIEISSRGNS